MERRPFLLRFAAMEAEGQKWVPAWKDIQSYIAPTNGFFTEMPNDGKKIDHKTIIDDHATRQLEILASGMTSGLTSPTRPWFRLGIADPGLAKFHTVKQWLDDVQQRMFAVFSKSNIYGVLNSVYYELGGFGTASFILLEDFNDIIRARNFTAGEYYLSNGPDGRVNGFARKFWMTVGQMAKEFGEGKLSVKAKNLYDNHKVDEWIQVQHIIEANDSRIEGVSDFRGKPFRSVYWEVGSPEDTFLRVSGFEDFPVLAPRWKTTTTADVYGRGPGWNTLGNVKMLQKMQQKSLIALDKLVDPPMQADASVEEDTVNLVPGGISRSTAMSPNAGLRPAYQINPDFMAIENKIEKVQRAIAAGFFADLFLMIAMAGRDMTAREVTERHEEKLLMLGPVLDRIESEGLDPTIDRTFKIMGRRGLLPPPPPELQGMELKVEYISILAQAQKMVGTTAIEKTFAFGGSMVGVYPEVRDVLNPDETLRSYAEMTGVPERVLRSDEEIASIRKQRAKDAAAAKAAQDAGAAVKAAEVLSKTKVGQGNALEAMAGAGQ